jgi:hypothetical protein
MRDAVPPFDPSLIPQKIDVSLTEDAHQHWERISARTGLSDDEVATYLLDRALQESLPLA